MQKKGFKLDLIMSYKAKTTKFRIDFFNIFALDPQN
jgi:hypothetical protein